MAPSLYGESGVEGTIHDRVPKRRLPVEVGSHQQQRRRRLDRARRHRRSDSRDHRRRHRALDVFGSDSSQCSPRKATVTSSRAALRAGISDSGAEPLGSVERYASPDSSAKPGERLGLLVERTGTQPARLASVTTSDRRLLAFHHLARVLSGLRSDSSRALDLSTRAFGSPSARPQKGDGTVISRTNVSWARSRSGIRARRRRCWSVRPRPPYRSRGKG
jgi:hypothetical protein